MTAATSVLIMQVGGSKRVYYQRDGRSEYLLEPIGHEHPADKQTS